jgi:hypothetical protein
MDNKNSIILRDKVELNATCNSHGWFIAMKIAELAVKQAEEAALTCTDKPQMESLLLKAQASREFLKNFNNQISAMRSVEVLESDEDFITLAI